MPYREALFWEEEGVTWFLDVEAKSLSCIIVEKFALSWLILKICGRCDGLALKKLSWEVEDKVKSADWTLDCVARFSVIAWALDEEIEGESKEVVVVSCRAERKVLWKGIEGMSLAEECEVLLRIPRKVEEGTRLENSSV